MRGDGSAGAPANVIATGAGTITVSVNGQHVAVYVTVALITGPLIEAEVDTENVGTLAAPAIPAAGNLRIAAVRARRSRLAAMSVRSWSGIVLVLGTKSEEP
jgi:hypothetical protein